MQGRDTLLLLERQISSPIISHFIRAAAMAATSPPSLGPAASGYASSSASAPRSLLPPTHPISLKLRSILTKNPSKQDEQRTREALAILEEMYPAKGKFKAAFDSEDAAEPSSRHRARRRTKDKERYQDFEKDVLGDDSEDATSIGVDVARAKRCLETDAQMELLDAGDEVVKLLQEVDLAVEEVQNHLEDMHTVCDGVDQKLAETSDSTRWLLEQAEGLQRQM